jgi:hypothetical protein
MVARPYCCYLKIRCAQTGPEHVLHALETLLVEVARIRQHGISSKQIAPALADLKVW